MPIIIHENTDLFKFAEGVHSIAHGVNCNGAMGKGIAVKVKSRWPHLYEAYKVRCTEGKMLPGTCWPWRSGSHWSTDRSMDDSMVMKVLLKYLYVYNVAVKAHWRLPSTEIMVDGGFRSLFREMTKNKDTTVAMPKIASGLGGLDWDTVVFPLLKKYSDEHPRITVHVCVPKLEP